jgi:hypothetical protein
MGNKLSLFVIFNQYDTEKYSGTFLRLQKILSDNLSQTKNKISVSYLIVDNRREDLPFEKIGDNVFKVGGNNSDREFSGLDKGIQELQVQGFKPDVVLCSNDSFLVYGWTFLEKVPVYNLVRYASRHNCLIGHIDTKEIPFQIYSHDVTEWICTNGFFIRWSSLKTFGSLVSLGMEKLSSFMPVEYKENEIFLSAAPLSENYRKMVIQWLTEEWHGKFQISEKTWEYFRIKTCAMINESLLSARMKERGIRIISYKDPIIMKSHWLKEFCRNLFSKRVN